MVSPLRAVLAALLAGSFVCCSLVSMCDLTLRVRAPMFGDGALTVVVRFASEAPR
jgi:hypothetical protein